jgi:hypothetical protein
VARAEDCEFLIEGNEMTSITGDDVRCGSCGYLKKPGYTGLSRTKGLALKSCKFFGHIAHAEDRCLAYEKAEADLPHCENCGNSVFPPSSYETDSRFCVACREFGFRKLAEEKEEKQRKDNEYLLIGLKIAALDCGSTSPHRVAWCTWDIVAHFPEGSQTNSGLNAGAIVGGMLGGVAGAMIGGALGAAAGGGSSAGSGEPSYHLGKFGLLQVTDRELIVTHLGRGKFINYPMFPLSIVKEVSDSDQMVAKRVCLRFPLAEIRPAIAEGDLVFSHKQQSHKFKVPELPEIAHQVRAEMLLRALREAGAFPPVKEYLFAVLFGPPSFSVEVWQRVSADESYWRDIQAGARTEKIEEERIFAFLKTQALDAMQNQLDPKYVDLLWLFTLRLPFDRQKELLAHWAASPQHSPGNAAGAKHVLAAFHENARRESEQSGLLTRRKWKQLEAHLSELQV